MKRILALAVALCMIICIGIKFNVVSMNSPEDLANQALVEEWQEVNSYITSLEEMLAQGDQTVLGHIDSLKQRRKELQKNPHVQKFIIMMNQAPIRAAILAPNCKTYLRPGFVNFIYTHSFEHFLQEPHANSYSIAWSPDGTKFATASFTQGARIWDAHSRKLLHTLPHNGSVWSVAWSPDGTKLATGSQDGARVWNANTGALIHTIQQLSIWSVAWSPDGTKLATGSQDGARVWNANTGALIHTIQQLSTGLVAWSPDGTKLAMSSAFGLNIWDTHSAALIPTLQSNEFTYSIAWSPDGTKFATASYYRVQIWDANTGTVLHTLQKYSIIDSLVRWGHIFNAVAWSPDGTKIATSGLRPIIWDANSGKVLQRFKYGRIYDRIAIALGWDPVYGGAAWSPDGTKLATESSYGAQIWNANTGALIITLWHNNNYNSFTWSPDSTNLATRLRGTGTVILNLDEVTRFLDSLNMDQCDLLRAIDMAMAQTGRIQATDEQWKTFTSFPQSIQRALKLYIKTPIQRSIKEREAAFEQRQRTASTTTEPTEESSEEQVQYIGDLLQRNVRIQQPDEPLQEQNNDDDDNDDDDDDNSLSSHGKEKDTGPRKIRRKK